MNCVHESGDLFSSDSGRRRSQERLDMNKPHLRAAPSATPKLVHDIALTHEEQDQLKNGSLSLSPERIRAGATTKTELMNEILQRDIRLNFFRHRAINEQRTHWIR